MKVKLFSVLLLVGVVRIAKAGLIVEDRYDLVGNSIPFGQAGTYGSHFAQVYMDIPAFDLNIGDMISFDIYEANDVDIIMNIAFGEAASNGGNTVDVNGFSQVVSAYNAGKGNNTIGDYDLTFVADAPWSFSGGGFIMGFQALGVTSTDTHWGAPFVGNGHAGGTHVGQWYNGSDYATGSYRTSVIPNFTITSVPEPASAGLMAVFGGAGWYLRRKFRG